MFISGFWKNRLPVAWVYKAASGGTQTGALEDRIALPSGMGFGFKANISGLSYSFARDIIHQLRDLRG